MVMIILDNVLHVLCAVTMVLIVTKSFTCFGMEFSNTNTDCYTCIL